MFDILTKDGLISFLYVLPALLISLSIHEFSHAYVAYKLGDRSQKAMGRLTIDPFAHIDWFGFLCIALVGFGWGKPVMVDDRNFKDRLKGNMLVSLAGPMSNLLIAVIFTVILKLVFMFMPNSSLSTILVSMLMNAIVLNVVFAVFNMLPIPPFDGAKVLEYFIPYKHRDIFRVLEKYSFYIIIIFLVTGLGSGIVSPIVNLIIGLLNNIL